jgi:methyltransferase (TIGR00027 family)
MKKNQSSTTAEGIAVMRAIEAQRPESERICYDPYARSLVSSFLYTLAKLMIDIGYAERSGPGVMAFITVRERCIDDFLKARLHEGLDQVVILGAGLDTRAYRIQCIEQTRVFEVDHPATQAVKRKRLKKVIDPLPAHVTFVPVDFDTQSLGDQLRASGYSQQRKTLFIWQGVTYYLTPQGVDSTLSFIAGHSGSGSSVIFDYSDTAYLQDTSHGEVRRMRRAARVTGEKWVFGIPSGQIEPFLFQRGFRDIRNVTPADLKRLYFTGPNAGREIASGYAIVSASVAR